MDLDKIIQEAFTEVYLNTTPIGDFSILSKQKRGWYEDYHISEELFESIVARYEVMYNLSDSERKAFEFNLFLGPSPRFFR